jgi:hypothetical protein
MPSIAEVFVTVLPSEPVDTTSFYKNVLRPALAEAHPRLPHRMVPAYPAVRGVRLHDIGHTFAPMQCVGGGAFHASVKVVGAQLLCAHTKHLRGLHPRRRYGGAEVGSSGRRAGNQRGGPRAEKSDTTPTRWRLWARA